MADFLVAAILMWIAYYLIKTVGKAYLASLNPQNQAHEPDSDAELIRDPQCGAYFMKQKGVKGVVDGQVIHFCSEQCYDQYLKSRSAK